MATKRTNALSRVRTEREPEVLLRAFKQLARKLLRSGYDSPASEKLLRRAIIEAATKVVSFKNQRITQSQIASIAGLSRLEVRKALADSTNGKSRAGVRPATRVERLVFGWQTDSQFLTSRGAPRALSFVGSQSEFGDLVRRYGRDVTKKTLLDQLTTAGIAQRNGSKLVLKRRLRTSIF